MFPNSKTFLQYDLFFLLCSAILITISVLEAFCMQLGKGPKVKEGSYSQILP